MARRLMENASLIVQSTYRVEGLSLVEVEKSTLAADKKHLVVVLSVSAGGQEVGSSTRSYAKKM